MICRACGCSELEPCLGGVLFPPGRPVRRMVDDPEVLPPGATCCWILDDLCSAHRFQPHVDIDEQLLDLEFPENRL